MEKLALNPGECFALLLDLTIKSTLLLALAWLSSNILRRTSAANRHLLWFFTLTSLIFLPLLSHALSDWDLSFFSAQTVAIGDKGPIVPEVKEYIPTITTPTLPPTPSAAPPATIPEPGLFLATLQSIISLLRYSSWAFCILAVWSIGMLLLLVSWVGGAVRVRRIKREAKKISEGAWPELIKELSKELSLEKNVLLLQTNRATMPMTAGVRHPVIFVSQEFFQWHPQRQRLVLLHELAHIKRRDCLMQMLAWLVFAAYWFNPLVWVALRKMHTERELACDDLVLSRGAKASDYASHLLEIANSFRSFKSNSIAAIAMARPSQLEGRLLAVLEEKRDRGAITNRTALIIFGLIILLLVPLAACRTPATPEKPNPSAFASQREFRTGNNPCDVARGDLDGDGKPDLVGVNYYQNTLSIFRNISPDQQTINYAGRVDLATGQTPITVTLGDVDSDGKLDLIVANHFGKTISIFRNISVKGTLNEGSFAPRVDIATEAGPCSARVCDLNRDGKPDLIVANNGHARGNGISIFENIGGPGDIAFAERIVIRTGLQPVFLAADDLDGDGQPDIVVANHLSFTVTVLRNLNAGGHLSAQSFTRGTEFNVGKREFPKGQGNPYRVAISDIDLDGKPDIIVGAREAISICRNTSSPGFFSFTEKVDFSTGSASSVGLAVGDLNGDGKPDIAVGNLGTNIVSVFFNTSIPGQINVGSFAPKIDLIADQGSSGLVIADLNGDGKPDLAVANEKASTISVFRNLARRR